MLSFSFRQLLKNISNKTVNRTAIRCKSKIDPTQEKSLSEKCFLVDENDKVIGTASKRECHTVDKNGNIPLHRAFSVFVFNNSGDLLLQKRSQHKVTYPNFYTNSCCSHPIADFPGEDNEENAIGIKLAAQRRLNHELGIPTDKIPLEKFNYITRIYYKDEGNGRWGEHEIDYVLFIQDNLPVNPNPNEISEISFVPRSALDEYLPSIPNLTPWFHLILKHRLRLWWDNLDDLDQFVDHKNILTFNDSKKKEKYSQDKI